MELKWLEDFLSLAETRSFSRSAHARRVTQSAFSRRIRSLAVWLGADLLDRSSYPIALTPEGRAFWETAEEVVRPVYLSRAEFRDRGGDGRASGPEEAKALAGHLAVVTDVFLRLIKMIVAPLVLATIVSGIASLGDAKAVGGIACKAMAWFVLASVVSLGIGLVMANLLHPGAGLHLPVPQGQETGLKAGALNVRDFVTHVVPTSVVQAMAGNEILQILVFSVFLGIAVGTLPRELSAPLLKVTDAVAAAMFKVTG